MSNVTRFEAATLKICMWIGIVALLALVVSRAAMAVLLLAHRHCF